MKSFYSIGENARGNGVRGFADHYILYIFFSPVRSNLYFPGNITKNCPTKL